MLRTAAPPHSKTITTDDNTYISRTGCHACYPFTRLMQRYPSDPQLPEPGRIAHNGNIDRYRQASWTESSIWKLIHRQP